MMNRTLGRDRIWDQAIWDDIDKVVRDEMDRVRVVRKVLPVLHPSSGPAGTNVIPAGRIERDLSIADDKTKRMVEISVGFSLSPSQVESERTLRTARILARQAAKFLALAEDGVLLHGASCQYITASSERVKVPADLETLAVAGLVGAAGGKKQKVDPADAFEAVARAIADLVKKGEPGPYALFLDTDVYAQTHAPIGNTLVTTADRIRPLLQGGCHHTGALNPRTGLLVSLAGESTTIYVAQEAITAYLSDDEDGTHRFKLLERVQYVERDVDALVRLEFEESRHTTGRGPVPRTRENSAARARA